MRAARVGLGHGAIFEVLFGGTRTGVFRMGGDALSAFRRFVAGAPPALARPSL